MSSMPSMIVHQTDPKASYLAHKADIDTAVQAVLDSGWYILGKQAKAFEEAFAAYVGVRNAIGVGSGTDALMLALRACGVEPGDLAFTVSHTAVATVAAIELVGAIPIMVDIDPATYTMDPDSLANALSCPLPGRPKAIIPVHLYGQPADMPAILELAHQHGLKVIEDCAQAHGAALGNRMTGNWGDMAAFSFYPTKNLGALGDGGMVVTDDTTLAEQVRLLQQYGWEQRFVSCVPGCNSRLDELQAAVLLAKLSFLEAETTQRCELAELYDTQLNETNISLPQKRSKAKHVYHQYVVRSSQRDELAVKLKREGIGTGIHYPVPVHLQPAYSSRLPKVVELPHTEQIVKDILSLPMYPQLTEELIRYVCSSIAQFFS